MTHIGNSLLAEQIDLLDQILANSIDLLYVYDRAGRYLYASPIGLAVIGRQAEEVVGKHWRELGLFAEAMERHDAQRELVFQTGIPIKGETVYPTVDGDKYYEYVISPIQGKDGGVEAVVNTGRDITRRKQAEDALRLLNEELEARVQTRTQELVNLNASLQLEIAERQKVEEALRESESRFAALIDAIFEGIIIHENGNVIEANPGFAKMFGYSVEEVIGQSAVNFLTPESLELLLQHIETQSETPYEVTGIKKDGTLIDLEVVGRQSLYQGRTVRISAARDITARKRAEATLRENQTQIQQQLAEIETIYQSAPIGLNFLDTELRFVRINQRLADMNGFPVEAHIGRSIRELLPDLADTAEQLLRPILETGEPLLDIEITGETPAQPGVERIWLESFLPLKDGDRIIGISTVCEEITDRKRAEAERRQLLEKEQAARAEVERLLNQFETARSRLEQILQQMPVGVSIAEAPSGKLIYCNDESVRLLRHSLLNSEIYQNYVQYGGVHTNGQSYQAEEYPLTRSLLTGEIVQAEEMHYRRGDGTMTLLSISAAPILDKDGQIIAAVSTFEDISDRKLAETAVQQSEEQLRLAFEFAQIGHWDWDMLTDQITWNPVHFRLLGLDPETVAASYENWRACVHPDDLAQIETAIQESLQTHTSYVAEYRIIRPDGSLRWMFGKGQAIYNASGQPTRMLGVLLDITDRKQAEAQLRERERLFSTLAEALPVAVFRFDRESNCIYINNYWTVMTGRTVDSVMGLGWVESLHPEDRDRLVNTWLEWNQNAQQRGLYKNEGRLMHVNGQVVWYYIQALAEVDADGETISYVGTLTDITNRKQAEQALQEREAILRLFARYAPAGIAMFDREMQYVMTSQRWAEDFHLVSVESLIGRSHYDVFPDIPDRWKQIHQRCLAGAIEKCDEDLFIRADGFQQWIRWEVRPWYTGSDQIGGIIVFSEDITQRKQAEASVLQLNQELQQKVAELQTLLDVIPIGIGIADDPECQQIRVNPAFAEALGISPTVNASLSAPDEERPTNFKVYQNGRELAPEELPLQVAAKHGIEIRDVEVDIVWQDGTEITLLEYAAPLLDEQGRPRGSVGAFLNITERKRAEVDLQRYKDLFQFAEYGLGISKGPVLELVNPAFARMHGYTVEEMINKPILELFPTECRAETIAFIQQLEQVGHLSHESYHVRKDGTVFPILLDITVVKDEQDNSPYRIVTAFDITDRKRAEQALQESEERYRTLAQNFPNGAVLLFDHDLRYVLAEGQGLAEAGLDRTMLEGKTLWEAFDSQTCRFLEPYFREALAGNSHVIEMPFDDRIYSVHCLPVCNDQGLVTLGMAVSQNITLQKQAEQVLRTARDELEQQVQARTRELQQVNEMLAQREREFRTLVENTPDVITRHDRQYRCLYINPASNQSIGMPPEFFVGKKPSELGYPEDVAQFWENSLESVFVTGKMRIDEFTVMNGDVPRSYQVCVVPERETDHAIVSVMTIGRDITKLRQAEEATRQLADELQRSNQELEQFAYIASHDLQEPLRAITSFTQLLAKRYQGKLDAKADTFIEFIVDGAVRMQQLVKDLLTYSRTGRYELTMQSIDCNALLERVQKNLQVAIAENQAVITTDPLPTINADLTQMTNLLQNLISNSLKYRSEAEPQIHISAKIITVERGNTVNEESTPSTTTPSQAWLFSIQDNGIGIEPQYADRIFTIFQRLHTSDEYSGTGLGLAICKKIIERHAGRIWVESQLGQGATFFFTIPILFEDSK